MSGHTESHGHHILPLRVYFGVAAALLVFTVVTVWVAQFDFGALNMTIAMLIAAFKASLVCLFFMHLLYDNKIYALVFISSLIFLAIFIVFVMYDVVRRDGVYVDKQHPIVEQAVIYRTTDSTLTDTATAANSMVTDSSVTETTTDSTAAVQSE
jgi:cytochrome c oxidase subunit 4